jgi:hypothetical protein
MLKKHLVLLCIFISLVFIGIAASLYPGGTISDKSTVGFIWSKNFISNLFLPQALNGADNPARIWAIVGMAFHSLGYGLFFLRMAKKMPDAHGSWVLKIVGILNIFFNFLVVTPLHDSMVTISSTLSMLGLFYITVYILRSKLHVFKVACILCMLVFYFALYLYGYGNWGLLAVMQKVAFSSSMLLVLGLEYFTKREHFKVIPPPIS